MVLLVQSPAALPEERAYAQSQCFKKLTQILMDISDFSGSPSSSHGTVPHHMMFIFQLVYSYVDARSMERFLSVYMLSRWHRSMAKLAAWLPQALMHSRWEGCQISLDHPIPPEGSVWLHPACQCAFRRKVPRPQQPPSLAQFKVPWPGLLTSRAVHHTRRARRSRAPIVAMAPWVAPAGLLLGQKEYTRMRDPVAVGVQVPRQSMCMPPTRSCNLFPQRQHTVAQVRSGLQGLMQFTSQLLAELRDYLVGDVGVSRQLAGIWDCHCICFNLDSLCRHPPAPPWSVHSKIFTKH